MQMAAVKERLNLTQSKQSTPVNEFHEKNVAAQFYSEIYF